MSDDLSAFKQLIKSHCGLHLEGIAEDRLRKALSEAAVTAGVQRLVDFYPLLAKDADLISDLVSQLTVNETYFFRENSQIQLLTQTLLPRLLAAKSGPIKIFSAGCSSGEEPYSLVMALLEAWGDEALTRFQVEAGDLDRQVLRKARQGQYSPFSFRGVSQEFRRRYFQPQGSYFQLQAKVREAVTFHDLNLLTPELPEQLMGFDVIFFRNVSIYFDLETRQTIQQKLSRMMAAEAILVMGSSETLANNLGVFQLVEEEGIYYFVKGQQLLPPQQPPKSSKLGSNQPRPLPPTEVRRVNPSRFQTPTPHRVLHEPVDLPALPSILALLQDQDFSLANHQLNRLLEAGQQLPAARLLKAWLLANRKEFKAAEELLAKVLAEDPWFFDALFLQALIHRWQGRHPLALDGFKKAVYLQTESWPAHYYLAESYRWRHDLALASQAYRAAQRLLATNRQPVTGLQLLPLDLAPGDARFLIEHQLHQLEREQLLSGSGRG